MEWSWCTSTGGGEPFDFNVEAISTELMVGSSMPLADGLAGLPTPVTHDDQAPSSTLLADKVAPKGLVTRRRAAARTATDSPTTPINLVV